MISKHSKTSNPHRLFLNLSGKINLKESDKNVSLSNLSIYYTWKNIKRSNKNNVSNTSAPVWNKEFELTERSYSISDIQYYFKHIFKK